MNIALPISGIDVQIYFLAGIVFVLLLIAVLIRFVQFLNTFSRTLQYLNDEIRRTEGREQRYYIHKRKRLWLSLIPFVKS
ncbi:MAG: hypothetical protein IJO04_05365 [Oscillospiraceae bacterium]|nr:hypothetical protein [Oscillospiraceae bacterium]